LPDDIDDAKYISIPENRELDSASIWSRELLLDDYDSARRHRFAPEIIQNAIRLYLRFT